MWTFGRKIAAGFALSFALLLAIGAVAYRSVTTLTGMSYLVTHTHQVLDEVSRILGAMRDAETGQRGFVIAGDEAFLEPYRGSSELVLKHESELRQLVNDNPVQLRRVDELRQIIGQKLDEMERVVSARKAEGFEPAQRIVMEGTGKRTMDSIRRVAAEIEGEERRLLSERAAHVEAAASGARTSITVGTVVCLFLVVGAGMAITRGVTRQIGLAVHHVQSSSTELQAAANQQVSGSREQATAMNEISTTITELLATSRQIADSAQRVARISTETALAARTGDGKLVETQESVGAIQRQVDTIVTYMIDLGKKSQQIGGILDIVNELAEQTNILAINATIEASGAGESGRRFSVVADEIRKLADRVGGSTKDIRALVDDIRSAVSTTVMATESGSKAVEAGSRRFAEVATAFKHIARMVSTTTEAAQEIELSTKQQATAVEQVKLAVASVSQAAVETEASSSQTLQTSSQLTALSRELSRLIQPRIAA